MNLLTNATARRIMASRAAAAAHNVPESEHCPFSYPWVHENMFWVFCFVRLEPKLHELVCLAVVPDPQRRVCRPNISWVWGRSACGGHEAEALRANLRPPPCLEPRAAGERSGSCRCCCCSCSSFSSSPASSSSPSSSSYLPQTLRLLLAGFRNLFRFSSARALESRRLAIPRAGPHRCLADSLT